MNSTVRVSVVMTTYNGSRFILPQLQSIYDQSRRPDEVIICDDRSADDTVQIAEGFISDHDLSDGWKVVVNEQNLGWQRNFFEATKRANGDVIFFSDQDDIWENDKIEVMTELMISSGAGCVYGNAVVIDDDGMVDERRTGLSPKAPGITVYSPAFITLKTLGCRMCISREVADTYIRLNSPQSGHDSQCGRIALLYSTMSVLDRYVIKYRIHSGNTSGISAEGVEGFSTLKRRISDIEDDIAWMKAVLSDLDASQKDSLRSELSSVIDRERKIADICFDIEAYERRLLYLRDGKGLWIGLVRYKKCYSGFGMLAGDFLYRHGLNKTIGRLLMKIK